MIHNHKFNVIKLMNNVKINDFNTVIFQHYTPGEGWGGGGVPVLGNEQGINPESVCLELIELKF